MFDAVSAYSPTRREQLVFRASFNRAGADRHAKAIRTLGFGHHDLMMADDTGTITYTVDLAYFEEVEVKLDAFAALLDDPAIVVSADIEELKHGHSVIVDLVARITRIRDRIVSPPVGTPRLRDRIRDIWHRAWWANIDIDRASGLQ